MNKCLLFILLCFCPFLSKGQCLSGWLYSTPITVTNPNASALTDFQVSITLNTQALITAGKMNAAGNDLRFVDANCTNLPYWIESGINTANTVIWVKVNSLPANGTNTISCYYGNSAAAAATDGNATFMLFDDFDGSTLDASKWTAYGTGSYSISGSAISFSTTNSSSVVRSNTALSGPYISEIKVNSLSGSWPNLAQLNSGTFNGATLSQGFGAMYFGTASAFGVDYQSYLNQSATLGIATGLWSLVTFDATHQKATWPGGSISNITLPIATTTTLQTAFGNLQTGTGSMVVDWFRARQYAAQTPTFAIAAEQVNKVAQTITFAALPTNKIYGDADFDPAATSTNLTIPVTYTSSNTAAVTIVGGKIHIVAAGTAIITASQAGDNTYSAAADVQQSITIGQASLTITADNQTKAYGAALPALTASYAGFVNGDTNASLTTQPALATTAAATSAVGSYPITASGAVSSNYAISYTAGNLTIGKVALTITADNQTKAYGAALPTLTASYSGFVNGDTYTSLTTQPALATTATTASPVGSYPVTASGAVSSNYTISYTAGNLTVSKVALTITANNQTKVYGAANPALTASYSGFVNGDTNTSLTTQPSLATTATVASSVAGSPYAITASGAVSSNYTISYTSGTLTVTPAALTIAADSKTKVYGSANPVLTASYTGFVNGDTNASLTTQPGISTTATAASAVGSYPITATGAASTNYTINYTAGTLTVANAALTITAVNQSKTYGAANPVLTASYSGFVNGDTQATLTTQPSVNTAATVSSGAGTYPITALGAAIPNYTISYTAGTLTVNKAVLTVTADDKSRNYGLANPALTLTYSGFVNGDTNASLATQPAAATTATPISAPGNYAITPGGGVSANYSFTYVNGKLTVIPLTIATLSNLTASTGSLSPVFAQNTLAYRVAVSNATTTINLTPTFDPTATARVNGSSTGNGSASADIPLTVGDNIIAVVVTAQDGITKITYTVTVYRGIAPQSINATNILSPNGDGKNDFWKIQDIALYPNNTVTIFDRAGRTVYSKHGYANDWGGTYRDQPLAQGVYYYAVDLGVDSGVIRGSITILRSH